MPRSVHRFLLAAYVGAALCFAALVTPALFATVGPAGAARVVGRVLPPLDGTALVLGLAALVVAGGEPAPSSRRTVRVLGGLLAVLALTSIAIVTPTLDGLRRAAHDGISALPPGDPVRRRFGMLHGVSTLLFLGEALLALALALVGARSGAGRPAVRRAR